MTVSVLRAKPASTPNARRPAIAVTTRFATSSTTKRPASARTDTTATLFPVAIRPPTLASLILAERTRFASWTTGTPFASVLKG